MLEFDGATVPFSSHQLDLVEDLCEDVVIIDHGRIVLAGELAELGAAVAHRFVHVRYRGAAPDWSRQASVEVVVSKMAKPGCGFTAIPTLPPWRRHLRLRSAAQPPRSLRRSVTPAAVPARRRLIDSSRVWVVIEIMRFQLAPGGTESEFLAVDRRLQEEFAYHQPGLLRRTTAKGAGGQWIVIDLWRSAADADACAARWDHDPAAQAFMALLDTESVTTERYATLD